MRPPLQFPFRAYQPTANSNTHQRLRGTFQPVRNRAAKCARSRRQSMLQAEKTRVSTGHQQELERPHTCPPAAQSTPVTSQVCPLSTTAARSTSDLVFPISYVYALPAGPPDASQWPHGLIASFEWKDRVLVVFGSVRGGFSGKHDCKVWVA